MTILVYEHLLMVNSTFLVIYYLLTVWSRFWYVRSHLFDYPLAIRAVLQFANPPNQSNQPHRDSGTATHAINFGCGGLSAVGLLTIRNFEGRDVRVIVAGEKTRVMLICAVRLTSMTRSGQASSGHRV